jgi:hypothetical protein
VEAMLADPESCNKLSLAPRILASGIQRTSHVLRAISKKTGYLSLHAVNCNGHAIIFFDVLEGSEYSCKISLGKFHSLWTSENITRYRETRSCSHNSGTKKCSPNPMQRLPSSFSLDRLRVATTTRFHYSCHLPLRACSTCFPLPSHP